MAAPHLDEVVGWERNARGKAMALQGARRRYRIGILGRLLLPELDESFAEPGDLLFVAKPPFLSGPVTAAANLTRRTLAAAPDWRSYAIIGFFMLAGFIGELRLEADGRLLIGAVLLGAVPAGQYLRGRRRAVAMLDAGAASRAELYWALARHMEAPNAPPRPKPEPEPEPDWEERLAHSFAGTLPAHEWVEAGQLPVPDGRLVTCDPYDIARAARSAVEIPPGTWPVTIAVGTFGKEGSTLAESRVTHAWLRLGDGPVVRWEAVREESGELFEVSVDSALAAFTSAGAVPALLAAYGDGEEQWLEPHLTDALQLQMALPPTGEGREWAKIQAGEARMIAFESGFGDGGYRLYRGFGPGGALVALAIDFRVAGWIYPH